MMKVKYKENEKKAPERPEIGLRIYTDQWSAGIQKKISSERLRV